MTPHLELGIGLVIGALLTLLLLLAFRGWSHRERFSSADSAETIALTKRILEQFEIFCIILDETANPIFANQAAREYDGSTDLDRQLRDPKMQQIVFKVLSTGEPHVREPKDPSAPDAIRLRVLPLDDYHVIVAATDVGHEQRVVALRRDFIANMSHELKTPIAAIGLLTEAILEAADDAERVQAFAKQLGQESRRLGELSRDVIRLSEAQASLAGEARERIDLKKLVANEVNQLAELAVSNGVGLNFTDESRKRDEAMFFGRASAIRSAVGNLITNAISYSPKGADVDVTLRVGDGACTVAVTDRGEGIDPQYHSRIFERFFRVDPARSRVVGGSGLGLSIVRNTMRAHGGEVSVTSALGEGATFELRFPLTESPTHKRKKKAQKTRVDRVRKSNPAKEVEA